MDLNKIISGITQSGFASGLAGGVAGGALTSALMSKKGRKYAGTALKVGGLAAVGGLAWKAYTSYRDKQSGESAAMGSVAPASANAAAAPTTSLHPASQQLPQQAAFEIDSADASTDSKGLLIVRAMIAAANADGHIDVEERQRIFERVGTLELAGEEKALLFDELSQPANLDTLVRGVGDIETGVEVYAASLLAIDSTCPQGRMYLEGLAARLGLPAPLVEEIHSEASAQDVAA